MIIERKEIAALKDLRKWILIYGRRKTGKTFLIENFIDYDEYFFIKRDRGVVSKRDNQSISYETLLNLLDRGLSEQKTIVVDEFHRLGPDFLDTLQHMKKQGKLILLSSTLHLSKDIFGPHSPILGFFAEFKVNLLSMRDVILALKKYKLNKKQLVELAIMMREPLVIDYFDPDKNPRKILAEVLKSSMKTVPSLIGEIFVEERRSISDVYEGVLRAVASGKTISTEISSYLFSHRLIKKDDASLIQQYLLNLVDLGILKKILVYNRNKYVYKHVSPLAKLFYYADEKYNISKKDVQEKELERIIDEILPLLVEDNIRALLAEKYGLEESVAQAADFDVDACLLRFKKPEIVAEVKWKNVTNADIHRATVNLNSINSKRKLLFVPDKKEVKLNTDGLEVIDISDCG